VTAPDAAPAPRTAEGPTTDAGRRVQRELEYLSLEPEDSIARKVRAIEAAALRDAAPPPSTRLVLMSEDLLAAIATRRENGNRLSFEWGEPDEHGRYTPVITEHADDNLIRDAARALRRDVEALLPAGLTTGPRRGGDLLIRTEVLALIAKHFGEEPPSE